MQQNSPSNEDPADSCAWVRVATLDELPVGAIQCVGVAGEPVALYNIEGTVCATSDTCTHGRASLSQGYLDGDVIECPLHQGLFHVPSGKAMGPPATVDIKTYVVRVSNGEIFVNPDG